MITSMSGISQEQMRDFFERKKPISVEDGTFSIYLHPVNIERYGFSTDSLISKTFLEFLEKCRYIKGGVNYHYWDPFDEDTLVDCDFECLWWVTLTTPRGIPMEMRLQFYHYPTSRGIPIDELPSDEEIREAALTDKEKILSSLGKAMHTVELENYKYELEIESDGKKYLYIHYNSREGYESFPLVVKEVYEKGRIVSVEQVEELILKRREFEKRKKQEERELYEEIFLPGLIFRK
jgi:hypothetical protein